MEDAREDFEAAANSANFATFGAVEGCGSSPEVRDPLAGCIVASVDESGETGRWSSWIFLRFLGLIGLPLVLLFSIQPVCAENGGFI